MHRAPLLSAVFSLALVLPAAGQRLGQPFPSRGHGRELRFSAPSSLRLRGFLPVPHFRSRIRPHSFGTMRGRVLPFGGAPRHLHRSRGVGAVLIVPVPWFADESRYIADQASDAEWAGMEDAIPTERVEDGGSLAPATGAYIAVEGDGRASLPRGDAGCAEVAVLLTGGGSYAAAVLLPSMGAATPEDLQDVLRDAHRHGRFVRLRGPDGLGLMIPAGPGIREIEVRPCR